MYLALHTKIENLSPTLPCKKKFLHIEKAVTIYVKFVYCVFICRKWLWVSIYRNTASICKNNVLIGLFSLYVHSILILWLWYTESPFLMMSLNLKTTTVWRQRTTSNTYSRKWMVSLSQEYYLHECVSCLAAVASELMAKKEVLKWIHK